MPEVRKAIHVGNLTYNDGSTVEKYLLKDVMDTVKPWVAVLMDNYKVRLAHVKPWVAVLMDNYKVRLAHVKSWVAVPMLNYA